MLFSLLFGIITAWCIFYAMRNMLKIKIEIKKQLVFIVVFGMVIFGLSYIDHILRLILAILFFMEFSYIYLKIGYLKAMLSGITGVIFLAIGELFSAIILINLMGFTKKQVVANSNLEIWIYIIIIPVVVLITWIFNKFNRIFGMSDDMNAKGSVISIIYVSILALFIQVFSSLYDSVPKGVNDTYLDIFFILTILFFLVNMAVIFINKRYFVQKNEYEQLKMYTSVVENLVGDIRRFRHDYANVIASMNGYIEMDDMDGLKDYYNKEIIKDGKKLLNNSILFLNNIKNPALKGLLSTKIVQAEYLDLKLKLEIDAEVNNSYVRAIDLCKMMGILIDNGIEAASESEEKLLEIGIMEDIDNLVIYVANSYKEIPNINEMFLEGYSTKGEGRGLGLSNLKKLIDNNYKNILLNTFEDNNIFKIELNIKRNKKKAA